MKELDRWAAYSFDESMNDKDVKPFMDDWFAGAAEEIAKRVDAEVMKRLLEKK